MLPLGDGRNSGADVQVDGGVRIAFDLDDTLVRCAADFPTENAPGIRRMLQGEPLRQGTRLLLGRLAAAGHRLSIYTSSERRRIGVHRNLWSYGVSVDRVINRRVHDDWWRGLPRATRDELGRCDKYPPAFGLDLLIDDSIAVAAFGRARGFAVARIDPEDDSWVEAVEQAVGGL